MVHSASPADLLRSLPASNSIVVQKEPSLGGAEDDAVRCMLVPNTSLVHVATPAAEGAMTAIGIVASTRTPFNTPRVSHANINLTPTPFTGNLAAHSQRPIGGIGI